MSEKSIIPDVIAAAPNRRNFVRKLGIATAAVGAVFAAGTGRVKGQTATAAPAMHPNDTDILNFALNLEYLEAEFYTVATTGKTLAQSGFAIDGKGRPGLTTGGAQVPFAPNDVYTPQVALELASDEQAHVNLLRSALGSSAVAKPSINLNALGIGFANVTEFLTVARVFEDVGVTAYAGAAPLIKSNSYLQTAAQILATEALHSGNIRLQVANMGIPTAPPVDSEDILPPPSGTQFFPTDMNGLVELRTPPQVLYIVYGQQANAKMGGFFPYGTNGYFQTSSEPA